MRNLMTVIFVVAVFVSLFDAAGEDAIQTLSAAYPGLSSGALFHATLGDLPDGVLLKSGDMEIKTDQVDAELANIEGDIKAQIEKNKLLVLENITTQALLLEEAKNVEGAPAEAPDDQKIQQHLEKVVATVTVTDEEVSKFYEENKDMCGGATLDQLKDQLGRYVLEQKQQEAITEYIRTIGQRLPIVLAAGWTQEQAKLAMDNPVDKARASGKPSLVDFGSTGCRPCDMMAPILKTLEEKYKDKANVIFIHVREEQILASRYGISSIPVQIFFDKDGKEIFRHTGFMPQEEVEKKMAAIGVS
jgi:thiol-disulfide isomerase/thioredoxin